VAGLLAWLWPIGLGGAMPVGGDVTLFSIGLMSALARSLGALRLPLWNDLWGFGFPAIAESQMGVYYPPHWLLYGLLPLEAAYTAGLVLHTVWAGLGAWWLARRVGASPWGSAMAGLAFGAGGFFLIHQPHQWASSVGSWLPWAWGLAWPIARGEGRTRDALWLAAVLAVQILPGHFQLAFVTEVGVAILAAWSLVERPHGWNRALRGVATLIACLAAVAPLAAAQLLPTLELARLAEGRRDFEYLSAFPASPLSLVSYVAPNLFHRSGLWRILVWDPLHAMPEEQRAYVGLAPLFLATVALATGLRRDPAVRLLAILGTIGLLLSLGPYVPGFAWLIRLPGFGFFRAPARWGIVPSLALAVLGGLGLDRLRDLARPSRALARFAIVAAIVAALAVGAVELAFAATEGPGLPAVADAYSWLHRRLPWPHDHGFREIMAAARRPQSSPRVRALQAREGLGPIPATGIRLDEQRGAIYAAELGESAAILVGLVLAAAAGGRWPKALPVLLTALTVIDLGLLGRHRAIDTAPIRPLVEQSAVLRRLAERPRGTRSIDPLRNLPIVAGADGLAAYRTLDLPCLNQLNNLARLPVHQPESLPAVLIALRLVGAESRLFEPFETLAIDQQGTDLTGPPGAPGALVEAIDDPTLSSWIFGEDWLAAQGTWAGRYRLWTPNLGGGRALFIPGPSALDVDRWAIDDGDPSTVQDALDRAAVVPVELASPERQVVTVPGDRPGLVVLSTLRYPGWTARWSATGSDAAKALPIRRLFGGWMGVEVPAGGRVEFEFRSATVRNGLIVSLGAWTVWGVALVASRRRTRRAGGVSGVEGGTGP